ncbi:MAG: TonB family protein [Crocinitomix sp.]
MQQFNYRGMPFMSGAYLDKNLSVKQGEFTYYDYNGNKKKSGTFERNNANGVWKYYSKQGAVVAEGNYEDDYRNGEWQLFSDNAKIKEKVKYISGKYEGKLLRWHNDTLIEKGQYKSNIKVGFWQGWHENGSRDYEGNFINGKRDGEWKFYFPSNKVSAIEQYKNGEVIQVDWFNEKGESITPTDPLEYDPIYPGEPRALAEFLMNNVNYPEIARRFNHQGIIYVGFIIATDGSITDVKIRKGVSLELDEEAMRVIKMMPKWTPAMSHGRTISMVYTLPIHFRLG